jgi:hypothetical protein
VKTGTCSSVDYNKGVMLDGDVIIYPFTDKILHVRKHLPIFCVLCHIQLFEKGTVAPTGGVEVSLSCHTLGTKLK